MAVKNFTLTPVYAGMCAKFSWLGVGNADTCQPVAAAFISNKCIQITGIFGAAGTVGIQGSNDDGATWAPLTDLQAVTLNAITGATIKTIRESTQLIRPYLVSGGDGTTALNFYMICVANSNISF